MGMKVIAVLRLCVWAATALQGRLVRDYTFLFSFRAAATALRYLLRYASARYMFSREWAHVVRAGGRSRL